MESKIRAQLEKLENEHAIKVIYACEGGSRATGLAHSKSDYDIRLIYLHKKEWYLSIDEKKDTIEKSLPPFEMVGWDLKKALQLLRKSNPTLLEWLHSPIIYIENQQIMEKFRYLAHEAFQPKTCLFHYVNMAKKNLFAVEKAGGNNVKRFINIIRPIYAAIWINENQTFPPVQLMELIKAIDIPCGNLVQTVIEKKTIGEDVLENNIQRELIQFFHTELSNIEKQAKEWTVEKKKITPALDDFFRKTLQLLW